MNDSQLLKHFADTRSPQVFAELVARHAGLVHSTAMRLTRDSHLAEDVTQATFLILWQKADRLARRDVPLGGWLYNTALYAARNAMRARSRRKEARTEGRRGCGRKRRRQPRRRTC
jgi:RNA polymerase sigma-70 factor (ECF subfamily)